MICTRRNRRRVAAAIALALSVSACSGSSGEDAAAPATTAAPSSTTAAPSTTTAAPATTAAGAAAAKGGVVGKDGTVTAEGDTWTFVNNVRTYEVPIDPVTGHYSYLDELEGDTYPDEKPISDPNFNLYEPLQQVMDRYFDTAWTGPAESGLADDRIAVGWINQLAAGADVERWAAGPVDNEYAKREGRTTADARATWRGDLRHVLRAWDTGPATPEDQQWRQGFTAEYAHAYTYLGYLEEGKYPLEETDSMLIVHRDRDGKLIEAYVPWGAEIGYTSNGPGEINTGRFVAAVTAWARIVPTSATAYAIADPAVTFNPVGPDDLPTGWDTSRLTRDNDRTYTADTPYAAFPHRYYPPEIR